MHKVCTGFIADTNDDFALQRSDTIELRRQILRAPAPIQLLSCLGSVLGAAHEAIGDASLSVSAAANVRVYDMWL